MKLNPNGDLGPLNLKGTTNEWVIESLLVDQNDIYLPYPGDQEFNGDSIVSYSHDNGATWNYIHEPSVPGINYDNGSFFRSYYESDGMLCESIYDISDDKNKKLWFVCVDSKAEKPVWKQPVLMATNPEEWQFSLCEGGAWLKYDVENGSMRQAKILNYTSVDNRLYDTHFPAPYKLAPLNSVYIRGASKGKVLVCVLSANSYYEVPRMELFYYDNNKSNNGWVRLYTSKTKTFSCNFSIHGNIDHYIQTPNSGGNEAIWLYRKGVDSSSSFKVGKFNSSGNRGLTAVK